MNKNIPEYILNFTIPAGPTGPSGATGPTGLNNIKAIISYMYSNTSDAGILTVNQNSEYSINIPQDNNVFKLSNDMITILENGYYVFSLSGTLMESTPIGTASVTLNVGTDELIKILQNIRLNEMHFSQTKMRQCHANENVTVKFNKDSSSNTSAESIYLIITRYAL